MAGTYDDGRKAYICREKAPQPEKKRKPLQRKKGIKRESEKRAMLRAVVNPGRKGFLKLHPVCEVCQKKPSTDVHEIARGNAREQCLLHPELQLAVCRFPCHEDLDDLAKWPPEKQLALRWLRDLDETLMVLNVIRGRAAGAIDESMVLARVQEIIREKIGGS